MPHDPERSRFPGRVARSDDSCSRRLGAHRGGKARDLGLFARLVRLLLVVGCCFAGLQFILEMAAWANRVRTVAGKSEARKREAILGDLAPFLARAAARIPEDARVLLVTNESPWRARYLLLPRAVYTYEGPVPQEQELERRMLTEEAALLGELGISWVVYYTRTTTGEYRIIDSRIFPVPRHTQKGEG